MMINTQTNEQILVPYMCQACFSITSLYVCSLFCSTSHVFDFPNNPMSSEKKKESHEQKEFISI